LQAGASLDWLESKGLSGKTQIDSLRHSNSLEAAWVDVVNTHDKDGLCKPAAVFKIRQQCQLLCQAYIFALARMNLQSDYDVPNKTWRDCCEAACESLNPCGNVAAITGRTIERWNMEFRTNNKFVHPNPIVRSGKCPEPSLFEHFPESKDAIKRFANGNLADLTTELLRDFIVTNLLPGLLKSIAIHDERKQLLDFSKEKAPATSRVWQWMRQLGYKYCSRKMSFYVDGHERAEQRFHRNEFTEEYLLKLEPCCHQWLQVSKDELNLWIHGKDIDFDLQYYVCGYHYIKRK
jgi:hypothetical protein